MLSLIGTFFDLFLIDPLTNLFVLLTTVTGSAGVAVILLTIIIRVLTFPLYAKQMHQSRLMAALQPSLQEINKKYSDPKRRQQEQMKLYKEAGFSPLGCFSGMLVQMPILMALYRTFRLAVGQTPEALIQVSHRLYNWDFLRSGLPLPSHFLWLNLGLPDPIVLPVLVGFTTYTLQKMTMLPTTDEKQRAQNQTMNLMMPLMFAVFTLQFPSGLGLYYVLSNIVGMAMQYVYVGGGEFNWRGLVGLSPDPVLPKALVVRKDTMDAINRLKEDGDQPADRPATKSKAAPSSDGGSTAATRRRRITNGRRRGRR